MLQYFLNPWMLIGLAGVLLPVLAHLLSRKKYDVIEWGAMQFLELDPNAKRKLRLEELLLLAVRMGLVCLLVIALARPWIGGKWLGKWGATQSRDVVIVLDGSYSMDWQARATSPHRNAITLARQFVDELRPGDSVMVMDAREMPRPKLPGLTRDKQRFRDALESLPAPAGTANLFEAISKSVQLLTSGTNLERDIIVMSDNQALSWKADDEALWSRLNDLVEQSSIKPKIWVLDSSNGELGQESNFSVDRLRLSRELAVPGVPVRVSSKVRYSGGDGAISRKVYLEVNGQRLSDQTLQVKIQPNGEATIEFEQRFSRPGSQLVSVVLDDDALSGDNRSDAVIVVAESLPVVLVDGDRKLDPTRCETFFARAALTATGGDSPWIDTTVVTPDELSLEVLRKVAVVVLANVGHLSPERLEMLHHYVRSGRGLLFALGDKVPKDGYAAAVTNLDDLKRRPQGIHGEFLLPVKLNEIVSDGDKESLGVRVAGNSLELPWLKPFRSEQGGTLVDARFSKWWSVKIADPTVPKPDAQATATDTKVLSLGSPLTIAKLTNGSPWIVTQRYGRGTTAAVTSSLDADWNTLPAKTDYVPWLHEFLFSLASPSASRNVELGTPLAIGISPDLKIENYQFVNPLQKTIPAERVDDEFQPSARLGDVSIPGVYRFAARSQGDKSSTDDQHFVANFDRIESDLTGLTSEEREMLESSSPIKFCANLGEMESEMYSETSRAELWWMLIYAFLGMIAFEVWMTRYLLRGVRSGSNEP